MVAMYRIFAFDFQGGFRESKYCLHNQELGLPSKRNIIIGQLPTRVNEPQVKDELPSRTIHL